MRVLHFFKTSLPDTVGGIEQVISQLASGTALLGVENDVLALSKVSDSQHLAMSGYQLHRAKQDFVIASTGFSISVIWKFYRLARRADIVHYHFPWPYMDILHFLTFVKKPTVLTYHSDIIRQKRLLRLYKPLKNKFLGSVDKIIATSPNYLESSAVLKKFSNKVSIIPIGLNQSSYPEADENRVRSWQARVGQKFFLFVGVIRYYKGLHVLLEASRNVDYPIVIVGAGPIELELKIQAAKLGLLNVYFLGHLSDDDKVALLSSCYAVVFPSHLRSEAFGISLLEGAMYGKPLISSEIGTGTTFINITDETGLVVPPGDSVALEQSMRFLWENPSVAMRMGKKARERYETYFTADKMVQSYMHTYEQLLKSKNEK